MNRDEYMAKWHPGDVVMSQRQLQSDELLAEILAGTDAWERADYLTNDEHRAAAELTSAFAALHDSLTHHGPLPTPWQQPEGFRKPGSPVSDVPVLGGIPGSGGPAPVEFGRPSETGAATDPLGMLRGMLKVAAEAMRASGIPDEQASEVMQRLIYGDVPFPSGPSGERLLVDRLAPPGTEAEFAARSLAMTPIEQTGGHKHEPDPAQPVFDKDGREIDPLVRPADDRFPLGAVCHCGRSLRMEQGEQVWK